MRAIAQKEAQEEQQKKYKAAMKEAQEQGVPTAEVSQASNLYYVLTCGGISEGVLAVAGAAASANRARYVTHILTQQQVLHSYLKLAGSVRVVLSRSGDVGDLPAERRAGPTAPAAGWAGWRRLSGPGPGWRGARPDLRRAAARSGGANRADSCRASWVYFAGIWDDARAAGNRWRSDVNVGAGPALKKERVSSSRSPIALSVRRCRLILVHQAMMAPRSAAAPRTASNLLRGKSRLSLGVSR